MLEQAVSSALYRLTLLEKALHSSRPWFLSVGAERVSAEKEHVADGVIFRAVIPAHAGYDVPLLSLWHDDELAGTQSFSPVDNYSDYAVEWYIRLTEAVAA